MKALRSNTKLILLILLGAVLSIFPFFAGSYVLFICSLTAVYSLGALGLNLLMGSTGLISMGHAAFLAVGAYFSFYLMEHFSSIPLVLVILLSGLAAGIVGFVLAIPTLKIHGINLAFATLAFNLITDEVVSHWFSVTGGSNGKTIPAPTFLGHVLNSPPSKYYLVVIFCIFFFLIARNVLSSPTGLAMRAMKSSEMAAECCGIGRTKIKVQAFVICAFLTGISGSLLAFLMGYIAPENFTMFVSIQFLIMVTLGGLGSLAGSIIGSAFIVLVPEFLAELQNYQGLVYGVVVIIVLLVIPAGIVGGVKRIIPCCSTQRRR